jgi:hypothetical protein
LEINQGPTLLTGEFPLDEELLEDELLEDAPAEPRHDVYSSSRRLISVPSVPGLSDSLLR